MADQIQGRDVVLKIFQNGRLVKGLPAKSVDDEAKQEMRERPLLGEGRDFNQNLVHGYKGTITFDEDGLALHELAQYLNGVDLSGVSSEVSGPVGKVPFEFAISVKNNYRDGTSYTYRFTDVKFMIPKNSKRGRKEDLESTMEWHARNKVKG